MKTFSQTVFQVALPSRTKDSRCLRSMPSPTPVKCRGPVVRQLSLQSPLHSTGFLKLKKQLSQDDARILDTVEVTGQAWPAIERSDSMIRVGFGEGRLGQPKVSGGRPKPAKVAWADKKPDSLDSPLGVEVVATKCQGQPRPLSIKMQRFRSPLIGNKDTLAYSRLQLAERLRNAWSERERTKPNINIFLAHGSDGGQSDNLPSDRQDNTSTLSDTMERKRKPLQMRAFSQEFSSSIYQDILNIPEFGRKIDDDCVKKDDEEKVNIEGSVINDSSIEDSQCGQELNRIEIRVTKPEDLDSGDYSGDKENIKADDKKETSKLVEPAVMSAKERRACFRTSSILHKAITESFSLPNEEENTGEEVTEPGKKSPQKKVLIRALSAPTSHDQTYEKPTPVQKTVKFLPQKRLQSVVIFNSNDDKSVLRDRIKSAPIRRKLKSTAARRKNKEKGDSSSEDEAKDTSNKSKKTTKRGNLKNGSDIITMVSLVSPAESETEDSVITLPIESVPHNNQREEITIQVKTPGQEPPKGVSFDIQKFVTLRKTSKTVTFQTNPVLTRNYSASFPSRRAPAGTPIIIPPPVISNPALTPAQLQERDKRPPVFTGPDGRGIKRRLIRSTSEPVKEEDTFEDKTKSRPATTIYSNEFAGFNSELTENCKTEESEEGEPQFKCPKEKECWALYKRMVAKGVSVTFDTVLRGMLTPTEYRLKKNRLLSTC